jgi:hypothetical protein
MEDVPAVGFKPLAHILSKGNVGGAINGNVVVVVEGNQFA